MAYFTLCTKLYGAWCPQFGDHSLETVEEEMMEYVLSGEHKRSEIKIVQSKTARQTDVEAAIKLLNLKEQELRMIKDLKNLSKIEIL